MLFKKMGHLNYALGKSSLASSNLIIPLMNEPWLILKLTFRTTTCIMNRFHQRPHVVARGPYTKIIPNKKRPIFTMTVTVGSNDFQTTYKLRS